MKIQVIVDSEVYANSSKMRRSNEQPNRLENSIRKSNVYKYLNGKFIIRQV